MRSLFPPSRTRAPSALGLSSIFYPLSSPPTPVASMSLSRRFTVAFRRFTVGFGRFSVAFRRYSTPFTSLFSHNLAHPFPQPPPLPQLPSHPSSPNIFFLPTPTL